MVTAGGAGTPGSTSSDFVLARFKTEQSGEATGGALDASFGSSGVATTDFAKNQAYSTGYDVCRGIDFAASASADHRHSIVAAGFSGTTSAGGNLALAEYLPKNRILVLSSASGAGFAPAPSSRGGATVGAGNAVMPLALLLSRGKRQDGLLSSA